MENQCSKFPVSFGRSMCLRCWWIVVFCLLVAGTIPLYGWTGVGKATYVGGSIPGLPDSAKGNIGTTDEQFFVFSSNSVEVAIPWEKINLIEYGQRAGRRIGLAIAVSPLFLMSKTRKHFLTLSFRDERDRQQALVFQLEKNHVRSSW